MAWIELHQSLPQHRKLLALRDALGVRTPAAIGHTTARVAAEDMVPTAVI